jgi:hypothetical protein
VVRKKKSPSLTPPTGHGLSNGNESDIINTTDKVDNNSNNARIQRLRHSRFNSLGISSIFISGKSIRKCSLCGHQGHNRITCPSSSAADTSSNRPTATFEDTVNSGRSKHKLHPHNEVIEEIDQLNITSNPSSNSGHPKHKLHPQVYALLGDVVGLTNEDIEEIDQPNIEEKWFNHLFNTSFHHRLLLQR